MFFFFLFFHFCWAQYFFNYLVYGNIVSLWKFFYDFMFFLESDFEISNFKKKRFFSLLKIASFLMYINLWDFKNPHWQAVRRARPTKWSNTRREGELVTIAKVTDASMKDYLRDLYPINIVYYMYIVHYTISYIL